MNECINIVLPYTSRKLESLAPIDYEKIFTTKIFLQYIKSSIPFSCRSACHTDAG